MRLSMLSKYRCYLKLLLIPSILAKSRFWQVLIKVKCPKLLESVAERIG